MKKFRKIMAVLVAAMMIMAMMVPAWAATTDTVSGRFDTQTGSITVNNANPGETYYLYKIFDLASFVDAGTSTISDPTAANEHTTDYYAYVLEDGSAWEAFFDTNPAGAGSTYVQVDLGTDITIPTGTSTTGTFHPVGGIITTTGGFQDPIGGTGTNYENDFTTDALYSNFSQDFARKALAYIGTAHIEPYDGVDANSGEDIGKTCATGQSSVSWSNLPLGYYLVSSTLGTLIALDTTNKDVTMYDKNVDADSDKYVQEDQPTVDSTPTKNADGVTDYGSVSDADIGDVINFRSVVKVAKGAKGYVAHDVMSSGFTFLPGTNDADVDIYLIKDYNATSTTYNFSTMTEIPKTGKVTHDTVNGLTADIEVTGAGVYNWSITTPGSDGHTFDISFGQKFLDEIDRQIVTDDHDNPNPYSFVILYKARLNKDAVIGTTTNDKSKEGNTNEFWVSFGAAQSTTPDVTTTYTWALDISKFFYDGTSNTGLPGAQFQITRREAGGSDSEPLRFVEVAKGEYRYEATPNTDTTTWTLSSTEADSTTVTLVQGGTATKTPTELRKYQEGTLNSDPVTVVDTLETNDYGYIRIYGLDGATYTVTETLAPRGFYKLEDSKYVHIQSVVDDENNSYTQSAGDLTKGQVILMTAADGTTGTLLDASASGIAATAKDAKTPANRMLSIENKTTSELPSTGGMGTTVLYIVGGMLVILAGAYLFFSRKKVA